MSTLYNAFGCLSRAKKKILRFFKEGNSLDKKIVFIYNEKNRFRNNLEV